MITFKMILEEAKKVQAKKLVVPCARKSDLDAIGQAATAGLISPCLIGNGKKLEAMIANKLPALREYEIVDDKNPLNSAINLIREGRADIIMQGGTNQRIFINSISDRETGLRKTALLSYVSLFELQQPKKLILITDTFVNNNPAFDEKRQILDNALVLADILRIDKPKVAVLAAIEQVNANIPSTLDAAILSKMSERKQFGEAIVEGPLDIDCALSRKAAERKGLKSIVPGNADIYLVPEIDTGFLLAEALVFLGSMTTAGTLLGGTNPVITDIPFAAPESRIMEIALAVLMCGKRAHHV